LARAGDRPAELRAPASQLRYTISGGGFRMPTFFGKVFTGKVFLEDRSSRVIISTYCRQNQGFASYKGIHREGTFEGKRLTADNFNIL